MSKLCRNQLGSRVEFSNAKPSAGPRSDRVKRPSLRQLRQQILNEISHILLLTKRRRAYHHWGAITRLPELDQEAVKVQPLPMNARAGSLDVEGGQGERKVNRDLPKFWKFGNGGSERHGDPFDASRYEPKYQIFEFRRFREVDRDRPDLDWKTK